MIISDKEIIGIKDYAELIGKLRLIAKDCHWQLLEDAADTIDELRRDAERYRWLRDNDPNKVMSVNTNERINRFFPNQLDEAIDYHAAIKESKCAT